MSERSPARGDRALVTGGAGFIGSHIVQALLDRGLHVTVLDDLSTGFVRNLPLGDRLRFVEGDVRDEADVCLAMEGAQWVLHHAALVSVPLSVEQPALAEAINVRGTENVFGLAGELGVRAVTFASSAAVYGETGAGPVDEDSTLAPLSPYGETKLAGEALAKRFSLEHPATAYVPLRYFNIYGPRQDPTGPYAAVIARFLQDLRDSGQVTLFGDGGQTRDFCSVHDVVQANWLALSRGSRGRATPVNVGSGVETTVLELARVLARVLGVSLAFRHAPSRAGDIRYSLASIARAKAVLGYAPAWSLEVGLRELCAWESACDP